MREMLSYNKLRNELKGHFVKVKHSKDEILRMLKNAGVEDFDICYYEEDDILEAYSFDEYKERLVNACILEALDETAIDINKLYYHYIKANIKQDTTIIETPGDTVIFFLYPKTQDLLSIIAPEQLKHIIL